MRADFLTVVVKRFDCLEAFGERHDMPIYEYLCEACGHELEAIQKLSDEVLKVCPACDKTTLKKKVTASAFRLSGSGWYETDFKTGDKRNLSGDKSSNGGGKSSSDTGSASSESKPSGGKSGEKSSKSDNKSSAVTGN